MSTYPVPTSLPIPPRCWHTGPDLERIAALADRRSEDTPPFPSLVPAVEQDPEAARRFGQQVQSGVLASRLADQLARERELRAIAEQRLTDALAAAVRERAAGWRDAAALLSAEVMAYRGGAVPEVATFGRAVVARMHLRAVEESRPVVPAAAAVPPEAPRAAA